MLPKLYQIPHFWPGALFLSSRPRGGDWLEDEVAGWKRSGIDTVVSFLTPEEELELDLTGEAAEVRGQGVDFVSYPIPDRGVPASTSAPLSGLLERIHGDLVAGRNVLVHCRQGIGRAGMIAASVLVADGMEPEAAIHEVSSVRGLPVPETPEQEELIHEVGCVKR